MSNTTFRVQTFNMKVLALLLQFLLALTAVAATSSEDEKPWEAYILSPKSRTVRPVSIYALSGDAVVTSDSNGFNLSLNPAAQVSLDFGIEVGGLASFNTETETDTGPQLSLAFAESPINVRSISDDATGSVASQDWDRELNVSVQAGETYYSMPHERFRGGFRFMTVTAKAPIKVSNITCAIGFSPSQTDLRDYSGYFYTPDDDLLTRIWYAGAYTVQTTIGPVDTGRFLPQVRPGWAYNSSTGVAGPILFDGAKRDRAVWPGDHGLAGTTAFLALGEVGLEAFKNALETMFYYQNSTTGQFPYAGPSTRSFNGRNASDTYHAWNLIAIHNYAIYTCDEAWVKHHWANITRGVDYILDGLDNPVGLHNQSTRYDWGRQGAGGYNSALNALDYHALTSLSSLASSLHHPAATHWSSAAARLKRAYNTHLWDPTASLYTDNTTTSLHPQDGNALALLHHLPPTPARSSALSAALTTNWNPIGPVAPELPDTISPFASSIEVLAHLAAGQTRRALALTRRTWGHLLTAPTMTGSTFPEGLAANGSLRYRGAAGYNFDPAYASLSHGWATGPTIALSTRVVGLEIVGWRRWRFAPLGLADGLAEARGGFVSPIGEFHARWWVVGEDGWKAEVRTPEGTRGVVVVEGGCGRVEVDGVEWGGGEVEGGGMRVVRASGCDV